MVTTKRPLVAATFLTSGIAALVSLVSLGTERWVTASATWVSLVTEDNYVNYGLFQGTFNQITSQRINFQLTMTCSFGLNVCALLCETKSEDRYDLLKALHNNSETTLYPNYSMENCASVGRAYSYGYIPLSTFQDTTASTDSHDKKFINAGVWLCTILFLCVSVVSGLIASGLAIYNTIYNPIEVFLSITALYVCNTISFVCVILYMTLWGTMYNLVILHDVGIYFTLAGTLDSNKRAYLGYSYWINFIPLVMYASSVAILYAREYLISKEPPRKDVHLDDAADPVIYLY